MSLNITRYNRTKIERTFKFDHNDKWNLVCNILDDTLKVFYDLIYPGNSKNFEFDSIETLTNSINNLASDLGLDYKYTPSKKLIDNYGEFCKVLFEDFALKTNGGGTYGSKRVLTADHITIVKPDYIDDDYTRTTFDISGIIDHRVGLFGSLNKTKDAMPESTFDIDSEEKKLVGDNYKMNNNISDNVYVYLLRSSIGLVKPNSSKPEATALLCIDIDAHLFKTLSLKEMSTSTFKNELFSLVFNKFFFSLYTNMIYFSVVSSYDKFRNVLLNNTKKITYFDIYMSLIVNLLSSNSINCRYDLTRNNPEVTLGTLLDSIRLSFITKGTLNGIILDGFEELRRFFIQRNYQYPIFIDSLIDAFMDKFRNKCGSVDTNKYGTGYIKSTSFSKVPKDFAIESIKDMSMRSNPILFNDNGLAINNFYGVESVSYDDDYYDKLMRNKRISLLGKLTSKERSKLLRQETEIARVKADCINCESLTLQKSLLKRLNVIGKDINDMMSRSDASPEFTELMSLVESQRRDIEVALSNRNFVKERRTRLYGHIKTTNEYDY